MKALSMSLLIILASFVFSSFKPLPAAMTTSAARPAAGTLVGYQIEGTSYAYFFTADLSGTSPYPLTQISVSRLSGGESLQVTGFSGSVVHAQFNHFSISGTATVTFIDNGTTVTKNLTGFIEGGIIE